MMMISSLSVVMMMCFFSLKTSWFFYEIFLFFSVSIFLWSFASHLVNLEIFSKFYFLDWLSWVLLILSIFITVLMLSGSYTSVKHKNKSKWWFLLMCLGMMFMLVMSFLSSNMILFYIFFEASLIPIFLMVMGWGYQPERLQASIYMLFYTLFASLPLLLVVLSSSETFFPATSFKMLSFESTFDVIFSWFFIFAFLVKLPMFGVHLWLPKAHVEAPVAGSMMLAGVLLKLGSYGLWRVVSFTVEGMLNFSVGLIVMGIVGGVIASFICSIQVDMKSLVAYSSVVHMGILLAGMSSVFTFGYEGALCMMLGHGIVSSGLFYMVGVMYDRLGSRSLFINKGLMVVFPSLTIFWFILCIYNISAPPSLSLLSEILLTGSMLNWSVMMFLWLMFMNFMSMVYTFYMYSQTQQGKVFSSLLSFSTVSSREYMVAFLHSLSMTFLVFIFFLF